MRHVGPALALALFGGCWSNLYVVVPTGNGDAGPQGTRVDGGGAQATHPDAAAVVTNADAAEQPSNADARVAVPGEDAAVASNPDARPASNPDAAAVPGRDASVTPPPPPQGAPYDHATEPAVGLSKVLDITGRYGIALAGGHLLASNAQGGTALPRTTPVSSSGTINIPVGATVHSAFLWYSGAIFMKSGTTGDYTPDIGGALDAIADVQGNGISFSINGTAHGPFDTSGRRPPNPSPLGSESQLSPESYQPHFGTLTGVNESVWSNRLDITGIVGGMTGNLAFAVSPPERLDPNGNDATRSGGNPAGNTTYNLCSGGASWSLVVVYELPALPQQNVVLMDGPWARAWDYLFFHSGEWHRPKVRIEHAPIQHGAKFYVYAASSSPVGLAIPTSPACSCGCGGSYTLKNNSSPLGRNNYFSDTLVDPPSAAMDPLHRDRTNGPWYLHSSTLRTPVAGNDWTLFQSGQVYTEFPNLYEGETRPTADMTQPVTHEDDADPSHDTYAGHPWGGRGTVTYHGNGNANSTVEVALENNRITVGERTSFVYLKGDQKDVWKPQQIVSVKYILFTTPVP